jgi:hypothetical protein
VEDWKESGSVADDIAAEADAIALAACRRIGIRFKE